MKFALRNKIPNERPQELEDRKEFVSQKRDDILNSLGIGHTKKTLVGNEFIRGVSGGERKRVSLAEVLAGQVCLTPGSNPFRLFFRMSLTDEHIEPCPDVGQPNTWLGFQSCCRIRAYAASRGR